MRSTPCRPRRLVMFCLFTLPVGAMAAPQPPSKAQAAPQQEATPPVEQPPPQAAKPKAPATEKGPAAEKGPAPGPPPTASKPGSDYGTPRITGKTKVVPARVCALYELGAVSAAKAEVGLDATCECSATKATCKRNWRGAQKRWHNCTCKKPPRCDVTICSRVQAFAVAKALVACKKPSCSCHRVKKQVCGQAPAPTKTKPGSEGGGSAKKTKAAPPAAHVYRCDCP